MPELSTYNSAFSYSTDGTSYTTVRVKTFPEVAAKRSSIDVTDLSDDAKRYIPGIRETSETLDFDANYDATVYAALEALADRTDIKQKLALSDGSTWSWEGGISPALKSGEVNGVVEMTISSIPATVPAFSAA